MREIPTLDTDISLYVEGPHPVARALWSQPEGLRAGLCGPGDLTGDLLSELVEKLPVKYRRVIEGVFWEGLSEKQMALQLGCARSTVQRRKARGLLLLRQKLTAVVVSST